MIETSADPFAVLGIARTNSVVVVKRAYFTALQKHSPQSDPEGFRRLRAAYEQLIKPGALAAVELRLSFDAKSEFALLHQGFGPAIAQAMAERAQIAALRSLRTRFEEHFSSRTWADAVRDAETAPARLNAKSE